MFPVKTEREHKKIAFSQLEPGDQILAVNGEDVKDAPRDHVIQLVRNCENCVEMVVCQPQLTHSMNGRKSTLLSPAKKHKLKTRPIRVRFAESVCVNGSPLFPVICFDLSMLVISVNFDINFHLNPPTISHQPSRWATFSYHRWRMCWKFSWKMAKRNRLNMIQPQLFR